MLVDQVRMKVEWYYVYSQRYYPFHAYLQDKIPSCFEAKGLFVDQKVFDEHLYRQKETHFMANITVKIEKVVELLQEKHRNNDSRPFFFTDVDIIVRDVAASDLMKYTEQSSYDMIFQREYPERSIVNPGISLLWPTENCLSFWETVLHRMKTVPNSMDMTTINEVLESHPCSYSFFDLNHVCSTITINKQNLLRFSVYHLLAGTNDRFGDLNEKYVQSKILVADMEKYYQQTIDSYGTLFL